MKSLCLILFLAPFYLLGQQVFYSPFTQTFPTIFTNEVESINRRIVFEPETITIATETKEGKEVEVLYIQKVDVVNESVVFLCLNRNKWKITIAIPQNQKQIRIIDYYYQSLRTDEEMQRRFFVEQIE